MKPLAFYIYEALSPSHCHWSVITSGVQLFTLIDENGWAVCQPRGALTRLPAAPNQEANIYLIHLHPLRLPQVL